MKVLWFSATPSLYEEKQIGGWIASLELVVRKYCKDIELGIAFEHSDSIDKKKTDNVTYYPMNINYGAMTKMKAKSNPLFKWTQLKQRCLSVVEDFKPDIIQVFGSEWPYGDLVNDVSVPVVVHMQGFLNIYNISNSIAYRVSDDLKFHKYSPKSVLNGMTIKKRRRCQDDFEKQLMGKNKYFFGRTEWDKNIVKYYSEQAKYFHCPEAIRPAIYESKVKWSYSQDQTMNLVTISHAGTLKGNEILLRTAKLLKQDFNFNFKWRVAGNPKTFQMFEKIVGFKHEDVNIELLGVIDAEQIAKELSQAHAYVHTAIIDNSPNSLCEAQLIGCPVIAANVGGIPQLVTDGKTGILYPYNEPHTLAFNIMNLYQKKDRLTELSVNEISMAHERHAPKAIADRLLQCYEEIIDDYRLKYNGQNIV